MTACAYSSDGKIIAGGLRDGSLQLWSAEGERIGRSASVEQVLPPKAQMIPKQHWTYLSSTYKILRNAHDENSDMTCLKFKDDGNIMMSRCMDGTLKIWDLRKFKDPIKVFNNLPNEHQTTQCCFSPHADFILTSN